MIRAKNIEGLKNIGSTAFLVDIEVGIDRGYSGSTQ